MKIRILCAFCCFILFFNCEDKQSSATKKAKISVTNEMKAQQIQKDESIAEEREFPLLTDKNAMEFFLNYDKKNPENKVRITTDFGIIEILLYKKTKFHRANFIFLTKQGYFNNTQFYRIVNNFIIQAGNSDQSDIRDKRMNIGRYLLPPDTKRGYKHHRGAVSMPSSEIENAYKLASPYEFFIVQSPKGAYHLDGAYTIFGEVTKGMDVVDKIAAQEADRSEWPLHNIYIKKIEVIN